MKLIKLLIKIHKILTDSAKTAAAADKTNMR